MKIPNYNLNKKCFINVKKRFDAVTMLFNAISMRCVSIEST